MSNYSLFQVENFSYINEILIDSGLIKTDSGQGDDETSSKSTDS